MPWKPSFEGEVPTLGYGVIDWIEAYLAAPDRPEYEPFELYREQEDYVLRWYELDPATGRRKYTRGLLGRPRGWGKSPILGALACVEGMGPVLFDGWDAAGQPVGRPWSDVRTPLVDIAAVSEEQTKNTYDAVFQMLTEGPVIDDPEFRGLEPMESFTVLPKGRISKITSSARSVKGRRTVFGVLDQTEEWVGSNGGLTLANTMRSNAAKVGGTTLESPNAFIPGEGSVAEESAAYAQAIAEGRAKDDSLLWDHREAPADTELSERDSLIAGLRLSYGDSSGHPDGCVIHDPPCGPGHVDLDRLVSTIWDPAQDVQVSRSDFLNQITHASDSWVTRPDWRARNVDLLEDFEPLAPGDVITLGFDGSAGRKRGKADATALIGCRVWDGHVFTVRVWEQPDGKDGKGWTPPVDEVYAEIRDTFKMYKVVGFLADPSGWASHVAAWEASYGRRLRVKATLQAPIAAWPRQKDTRVVEYVKRLHDAIIHGEMTHDGSGPLTRHVLNARRRSTTQGYLLYKAYPDSPDKIDAAYAAVLAWKARLDAVAKGIGRRRATHDRPEGGVLVLTD